MREVFSRLFGSSSSEAEGPSEMEVIASRLEGTERHPLRRIPAEGLS